VHCLALLWVELHLSIWSAAFGVVYIIGFLRTHRSALLQPVQTGSAAFVHRETVLLAAAAATMPSSQRRYASRDQRSARIIISDNLRLRSAFFHIHNNKRHLAGFGACCLFLYG